MPGRAAYTVTLAAVLVAGCGSAASRTKPNRPAAHAAIVARGRRLFIEQGCGACHALAATGGRGGIGPNLDTSERLNRSQLQTSLVEGSNGMPSYAGLSATSREAVVEFLYTETHRPKNRPSRAASP